MVRPTAVKWVLFVAAIAVTGNLAAEEMRIDLKGVENTQMIGVSFKQGELADVAGIQLLDPAGKKVPFKSWTASKWSDGSIRGLVLELGEKAGSGPLLLKYSPRPWKPDTSAPTIQRPVAVIKPGTQGIAEDFGNHVFVRTGTLQILIHGVKWRPIRPKKARTEYAPTFDPRGLSDAFKKRFKINPTPWTEGKKFVGGSPGRPIYPVPYGLLEMVWLDLNKDGKFADDEKILSPEALPGLVLCDVNDHYYLSQLRRPKKVRIVRNGPEGCTLEVSGALTRLHPTGHAYRDEKKLGYQSWLVTSYQEPDEAWFIWTAVLTFKKGSSQVTCDLTVERGGPTWKYGEFGRREVSKLVPMKTLALEFTSPGGGVAVSRTSGRAVTVEQPSKAETRTFLWKRKDNACLAVGEGFALSTVLRLDFQPKEDK